MFPIAALLLGLLSLSRHALSQQSPPLQGQGQPPDAARHGSHVVPVYVSVELVKLISIDEQEYTFQGVFRFELSWVDPRAPQTFSLINAQDKLYVPPGDSAANSTLTTLLDQCTPLSNPANWSSPECTEALGPPPGCTKYCTTYGTTTDNPYRCCDLVWLPAMGMNNLIDTSQDRIVVDAVWNFNTTRPNHTVFDLPAGVHRSTLVQGRFFAPLSFKSYPFDSQSLQVFLGPENFEGSYGLSSHYIVPSATIRRVNVAFTPLGNLTGNLSSSNKDELGKWNIDSVSFDCASFDRKPNVQVWQTTQPSADSDPYADYTDYLNKDGTDYMTDPNSQLQQTCALTIKVSRLSSTLVVQSIVPVSFIGALAFIVFISSPDAIDLRLGTEVSLFLALTAIQFIFVTMLPLTTYLTKLDVFILLTYCVIVALVIESLIVYLIATRKEHMSRRGTYAKFPPGLVRKSAAGDRSSMVEAAREPQDGALQECLQEGSMEKFSIARENDLADGSSSKKRSMKHSVRKVISQVQAADSSLVQDEAFAYHMACQIDRISGAALFLIYLIIAIVNFTVGLN